MNHLSRRAFLHRGVAGLAAAGVAPSGARRGWARLYPSRHSPGAARNGVRRRATSRVRPASRATRPRAVPLNGS